MHWVVLIKLVKNFRNTNKIRWNKIRNLPVSNKFKIYECQLSNKFKHEKVKKPLVTPEQFKNNVIHFFHFLWKVQNWLDILMLCILKQTETCIFIVYCWISELLCILFEIKTCQSFFTSRCLGAPFYRVMIT